MSEHPQMTGTVLGWPVVELRRLIYMWMQLHGDALPSEVVKDMDDNLLLVYRRTRPYWMSFCDNNWHSISTQLGISEKPNTESAARELYLSWCLKCANL